MGPPFRIVSTCKGGGYRYARTEPLHPKANAKGLYPLHRVLMENKLGRILSDEEIVHHKDEDKSNDALSNLEVKSNSLHSKEHQEVDYLSLQCSLCSNNFRLKPHAYRLRMKRNRKGSVFCSRSCATKAQYTGDNCAGE